ncbi:hypothetical protein NL108_001188 [Boleophthalmus pectinirostris]|uniref:otoancorin n=1 Tax=Boleophthalmus pectinirostris TaxID=150288 RepID=UPI0024320DB7|nr:otoancorin [Boleophthalmus pectinirostris]KAJ0065976.1 hypothetical protein NL108_001188 [Boleophthalmus pectinirostris]
MGRKGGTVLLLMCCVVLVTSVKMRDPRIKNCARQLMKNCQREGYETPDTDQLATVLNSEKDSTTSPLLAVFDSVLESVSSGYNPSKILSSLGKKDITLTADMLPKIIQKFASVSESSACYLNAIMAPLAWDTVTNMDGNMNLMDYKTLLSAAKPMITKCREKLNLPQTIMKDYLYSLMEMLNEVYPLTTEDQRNQVINWAKEKIKEDLFNCSSRASSGSVRCSNSLKWLTYEFLTILGPYLSELTPADLNLAPKEQLCNFFKASEFKPIMDKIMTMKPSLAQKLLSIIQKCFSNNKEFMNYLDRLGPLVCYYNPPSSQLTANDSITLLSALSKCDDRGLTKIKKKLLDNVNIKGANVLQTIRQLGVEAKILGNKIKSLSKDELRSLVNDSSIKLSKEQKRMVLKTFVGDDMCKQLSEEELKDLSGVADALPICIYKKIKPKDLEDREVLKKIVKNSKKSQGVAILRALGKMNATEMMNLPDELLQVVPLRQLEHYNNIAWDKIIQKKWRKGQATYFAMNMTQEVKDWYRNAGSILLGVTCKQIEAVADSEVLAMAQSLADTPQWLSKAMVRCISQKLFSTLESQRTGYFKTITTEELNSIPAIFLIQLPAEVVQGLPDSVCSAFLQKMEMLNISRPSLRSASLPALTQKALSCLGSNMSSLTTEDMNKLGPLVCEVSPTKLRLLEKEVLKTTLQAMASCYRFPEDHREGLLQLVNQTFGDPSTWTPATVEELGRLLFLYGNTSFSLSKEYGMKTAVSYLLDNENVPEYLRKILFNLTVSSTPPPAARRKREANPNSNAVKPTTSTTTSSTNTSSSFNGTAINAEVPTVELITDLKELNVYWTPKQLEAMTQDTFNETVDILGAVTGYSPEQLKVLSGKAVQAFGSTASMNETEVAKLGCISQGFTADQLVKMSFSLDSLDDIAKCGWNDLQVIAVWKAAAKFNSLTPAGLAASDMVALSRFMCGLNAEEIKQLNVTAFTEAVGSLSLQCPAEVMQQYKNLTMKSFGAPDTWTPAVVSDLGTFIAGLSDGEFASLDVSVFQHISKDCIPLIPPANLAALSVTQIEALGPDNAGLVTQEQKAAMTAEQLGALSRAIEGVRNPSSESGNKAPPLATEGIGAFFKPLLFLVLGLILL